MGIVKANHGGSNTQCVWNQYEGTRGWVTSPKKVFWCVSALVYMASGPFSIPFANSNHISGLSVQSIDSKPQSLYHLLHVYTDDLIHVQCTFNYTYIYNYIHIWYTICELSSWFIWFRCNLCIFSESDFLFVATSLAFCFFFSGGLLQGLGGGKKCGGEPCRGTSLCPAQRQFGHSPRISVLDSVDPRGGNA